MTERTWFETLQLDVEVVTGRLGQLLHEGTVRRLVIWRAGAIIAEFPITVAVIGAVLSPVVATLGALAALLADCQIKVERSASEFRTTAPLPDVLDTATPTPDV